MASLYKTGIQNLKGIGVKTTELFNKLGIKTIGELINFYPRKYEDWSNPHSISEAYLYKNSCVKVKIIRDFEFKSLKNGYKLYRTEGTDGASILNIIFFNNSYAPKLLKKDEEYLLLGKITKSVTGFEIISPKIKKLNLDEGETITPVYPQTESLVSSKIAACVKNALSLLPKDIPDSLPKSIREKYSLCDLRFSLNNIHFPKDKESLKIAQSRLIFEEFFVHLLGINILKNKSRRKTEIKITNDYSAEFFEKLPFELTLAQKKVISESVQDMYGENFAMNRLLQGDVGSGKTVVAAALAYNAVKNGFQVAIMVPTEILAVQHFNTFKKFFSGTGINVEALYSSLKTKRQNFIKAGISVGIINIVIGTHSLISENVQFKNLGFIVTDEQHRFGVNQRKSLVNKGNNPHVLVMSATPIPRTLAMVFYGDLGISIIDEPIPGRQKIDTFYVNSEKRERVLKFLKHHVEKGFQGYVVCAGVEENEKIAIQDIKSFTERLIKFGFEENKVAFIHGKMSGTEKEEIMTKFNNNEISVLVATTVIEVGVDNPNAVMMIIENAERFGISQLHQLRGRVGRGSEKSYCVLISDSQTKDALRRFEAMKNTNDGFALSEEDLKIRGPGDFFGVDQHGIPNIKVPTTYEDVNLIKQAQDAAKEVLKKFPNLENEEFKFIKTRVQNFFDDEDFIINS